jgi:class 3 adenylate cyclase
LPWIGESAAVLDQVAEFVTGSQAPPDSTRKLATIVFTDVVGSTNHVAHLGDAGWNRLAGEYLGIVRASVVAERGEVIDTAGDGVFAVFDGPGRAIAAALAAVEGVRQLGIEIRAGVHTGEVETAHSEVRGLAVHIGARIADAATASEVVVSQTVKDLLQGTELTFQDLGERELKGLAEPWHLYRVNR